MWRSPVPITAHSGTKGLQPGQSRRWSFEQNRGGDSERRQGVGSRLGEEGRSPMSGALGRQTRAEGKRLLSPTVLPFSVLLSVLTPLPKLASLIQSKAAPFIVQGAAVTYIKDLPYHPPRSSLLFPDYSPYNPPHMRRLQFPNYSMVLSYDPPRGAHVCRLEFLCDLLRFRLWPGIFTTSTPTNPHILRYVPG